ncbi:hypothetical protein AArcCO_0972 [Halalkaliarchaeum sp. AArc-CO]|nr:hypothetical protein AArcCO_0972 [Halalkaliarchaeum sp. AArc-CO]
MIQTDSFCLAPTGIARTNTDRTMYERTRGLIDDRRAEPNFWGGTIEVKERG